MKRLNDTLRLSKSEREYPLFKNVQHFYRYSERGIYNRVWKTMDKQYKKKNK